MPRPARPMARAAALLALSVLASTAVPGAAGAAWLPLALGIEWQYVDEFEDPNIQAITETVHIRGRRAFVKTYTGGADDGLLNFWQEGPDGSVLLCGYYRPAYPFGLVYEPPVKVFPGQPAVGLEWTTHTVAISIPDNAPYGEFDLYWAVAEEVAVQVPAGTFMCFGVGQVAPPALQATTRGVTLGLDGRITVPAGAQQDDGPASASEWYANGIGLVQYDTGSRFVLQSTNVTTPATTSSWGRIKRLYR